MSEEIQQALAIADKINPPIPRPAPQMTFKAPPVRQELLALEARISGIETAINRIAESLNRPQYPYYPAPQSNTGETALLLKTFMEMNVAAQAQAQKNAESQLTLTKDLLAMVGQAPREPDDDGLGMILKAAPLFLQAQQNAPSPPPSPSPPAIVKPLTPVTGGETTPKKEEFPK